MGNDSSNFLWNLLKTSDGRNFLFCSMSIGDHQHSKLVWFYHTGIGGHNLVNGQGWKIKTLQTLLTELGDAEVGISGFKIKMSTCILPTLKG